MRKTTTSVLIVWSCLLGLFLGSACSGGNQNVDTTFTAVEADDAYQRGVTAHNAGDLLGAEENLRQALTINPRFLAAYLELGSVLLDAGQPGDALEAYDRAIAIRERSGEAWSGRAAALLTLGRPEEAAAAAEEAIAYGNVEDSSFILAMAFKESGDVPQAIELLEQVLRDTPERAGVRVELANLYVLTGRQNDAVPLLERGARLAPNDGVIWRGLADLYHSLAIWDRAIEAWQKVAELTDEDEAFALTRLGEAHIEMENIRLAIQALDEAVSADPRFTEAYVLRGYCELQRGFLEGALSNANTALEISSHELGALMVVASVRERQGDIDGAISTYQEAIFHHPEAVEPAIRLADHYLALGLGDQALEVLAPHEGSTTQNEYLELLLNAYLAVGEGDRVMMQLVQLIDAFPREHERILSLVQVALENPSQTVLTTAQVVEYAERGVQLTGGYRLEYRLALIDALAADGQRQRALDEAVQALDELPNSPDLEERIRTLRR